MQELPLVLVIEDDPDIQIVVEDALTEGGFEPAIAASGEEAVTLLKSGLIKYRDDWNDPISRELLYEQIPQAWTHQLQWKDRGS